MTDKDKIKWLEDRVDFLSRNYVTGLHGRHVFMQRIREKFNEKEPFFLAMHDVDGLHEVNRINGYAAGDALLREVANDLKMCQEPCCVFHIGGDEFYVLYSDEPDNLRCANTTVGIVKSIDYKSVDEMLNAVDKLVSEEKLKYKKRRREDV